MFNGSLCLLKMFILHLKITLDKSVFCTVQGLQKSYLGLFNIFVKKDMEDNNQFTND